MNRFTARTEAGAVVAAERQAIWDALVDPGLLARMTPFVKSIEAEDDRWFWQMSGLEVLGVGFSPVFTEKMSFTDLERIDFAHEPPAGATERTGVNGWYHLSEAEAEGGTRLRTSLEVVVELPLPRLSSPAVTTAMKGVMATMGDRFARNLLDHLGVRR